MTNLTKQRFKPPFGAIEIKHLRRAHSKTFSLGNEKFRTILHSNPVHWDNDGTWEDYVFQPVMTRTGTWVINKGLPYEVTIPKNTIGFGFKQGDREIAVTLRDADGQPVRAQAHRDESGFRWDISDDFGIFLQVRDNGIEFFKLLNNADAPKSLTWTVEDINDGRRLLRRTISPLVPIEALDSNGDTFDVAKTVEKVDDHTYLVTEEYPGRVSRIVDESKRLKRWFDDPSYPVIVDIPDASLILQTRDPSVDLGELGDFRDRQFGESTSPGPSPFPPVGGASLLEWEPLQVVGSYYDLPRLGSVLSEFVTTTTVPSTKSYAFWDREVSKLAMIFRDIPVSQGTIIEQAVLNGGFSVDLNNPPSPLVATPFVSSADNADWTLDGNLGVITPADPNLPANWPGYVVGSNVQTLSASQDYNWDVTTLVQNIIDRPGWEGGNDIKFGVRPPNLYHTDIPWESNSTQWWRMATLNNLAMYLQIDFNVSWDQVLLFRNTNDLPDLNGWSVEGDSSMRMYQADYLRITDDVVSDDVSDGTCQFYRVASLGAASAGAGATMQAVVRIVDDTAYGTSKGCLMQMAGSGVGAYVNIMKNGVTLVGAPGSEGFREVNMQEEEHQITLIFLFGNFSLFVDGDFIADTSGFETDLNEIRFGAGSPQRTSDSLWHSLKWTDGAAIIPTPTQTINYLYKQSVLDYGGIGYWPMDDDDNVKVFDGYGVVEDLIGSNDLTWFNRLVNEGGGGGVTYTPTPPENIGDGFNFLDQNVGVVDVIVSGDSAIPSRLLHQGNPILEALQDNNAFTIEAWIYLDTTDPSYAGGFVAAKIFSLGTGSTGPTQDQFSGEFTANLNRLQGFAQNGDGTAGTQEINWTVANANEWHLVHWTYDGVDLKMYTDGIEIDTNALSAAGTLDFTDQENIWIAIGGTPGDDSEDEEDPQGVWSGMIHKVALFATCLAPGDLLVRADWRTLLEQSGHEDLRWDETAYANVSTDKISFDYFDWIETASVTVEVAAEEEIVFIEGVVQDLGEGGADLVFSATEGDNDHLLADEDEMESWQYDEFKAATMRLTPKGYLELRIEAIDPVDAFIPIRRRSIIMDDVNLLDQRGYPTSGTLNR